MKKGGMYNRIAFNYYESNREYNSSGNSKRMPNNGRFYDRNISWYEEFGITHDLTFITSVYYKWLSYHDDYVHNRANGPGDLEIGLKYGILTTPVVVSIQGLIKYGELYGDEDPEIGDGQNDYEIRLLFGKSLWPLPGYVGLETAYRWRSGAPADEFRYLAEFGMNFTKRFYGRVKIDGILTIGNSDSQENPFKLPNGDGVRLKDILGSVLNPPATSSSKGVASSLNENTVNSNPSLAPEYDIVKLDITLGYWISKRVGLEAQYTPVIYGERIGKGWTGSLALIYMW